MAPNIATTSAPPSVRKKFNVPVAVPSWCGLTTFCMTIVETGYIGPRPKPSTNSSTTTVAERVPRRVGGEHGKRRDGDDKAARSARACNA